MNLLIRADASVAMGTGHVMRCLALAQAWQDAGGAATFAVAEITPPMRKRLAAECCEVVDLCCLPGTSEDAKQTSALARERDAKWIVVDGYQFTSRYQKAMKDTVCKLLLVDDDGRCDQYDADLVLNQNVNADQSMYAARQPYTRLLLGTQFCLLRREFAKWREWKRDIPRVARKVLITMGGSDPDNVTDLALCAFTLLQAQNVVCTVVAPPDHSARRFRRPFGGSKSSIEWNDSVPEISEFIAQADLGIIAAGVTLWELLYMSCPVLSFARNSVQRDILAHLEAAGTVQCLGNPKETTAEAVSSAIQELATSPKNRAAMAERGRRTVDGKGASRICELMLEQ